MPFRGNAMAPPPLALITLCVISLLCVPAVRAGRKGDTCDDTIICVPQGGNCSSARVPDTTTISCVTGTYCEPEKDICEYLPRLGENCSPIGDSVSCFDEQHQGSIGCDDGVCRYGEVFFPGEECPYGDERFDLASGGCTFSECLEVEGVCQYLQENDKCTTYPDLCGPHLFCDSDNAICQQRKQQNASCYNHRDCDPMLICTSLGGKSYTCQPPYAQELHDNCESDMDCAAGLTCKTEASTDSSGNPTYTSTCQYAAPPPEGDCGNDTMLCNQCKCGIASISEEELIEDGTGVCIGNAGSSQEYIEQFLAFQACAKANNCADWWIRTALTSYMYAGPESCIASCNISLLIYPYWPAPEGSCFVVPPPTTPPPTTEPPSTTAAQTEPPTDAPTATVAVFTIQLTSCLSGPSDPALQQLIDALAASAGISSSQIKVIAPESCPSLALRQPLPYEVQVFDDGGNALVFAKEIVDDINGNALSSAPGVLMQGPNAATEPQILSTTVAPSSAPPSPATTGAPTSPTTSSSTSSSAQRLPLSIATALCIGLAVILVVALY